jgi:hypothetical protein
VLSNLLLSGVRNRWKSLQSLLSSSIFFLVNIGQSCVLSVSACSFVTFQLTPCIASLKNLTAASISSSVLRETFKVNLFLISCLKPFQFVCLLFKLGYVSWFSVCACSVIKTGDWLEDRSKHDFATAKSWGIPFITQESTRSGSLFLSDGQRVCSTVDRRFKFLSIV